MKVRWPVHPYEIYAIRHRRGFRGKLILQIQRVMYECSIFDEPKRAGLSVWKDADANNLAELQELIQFLADKKEKLA